MPPHTPQGCFRERYGLACGSVLRQGPTCNGGKAKAWRQRVPLAPDSGAKNSHWHQSLVPKACPRGVLPTHDWRKSAERAKGWGAGRCRTGKGFPWDSMRLGPQAAGAGHMPRGGEIRSKCGWGRKRQVPVTCRGLERLPHVVACDGQVIRCFLNEANAAGAAGGRCRSHAKGWKGYPMWWHVMDRSFAAS